VQVHDAFLVLQPPVSTNASLRSLQCACKASAVESARLNAPSKTERAVIAYLRGMFSSSPSLSVQVCTNSHHFHTISILLLRPVHLHMQESHSYFLCERLFLLLLISCTFAATCPYCGALVIAAFIKSFLLLTSCSRVSHSQLV
jgi:hypothetical protein